MNTACRTGKVAAGFRSGVVRNGNDELPVHSTKIRFWALSVPLRDRKGPMSVRLLPHGDADPSSFRIKGEVVTHPAKDAVVLVDVADDIKMRGGERLLKHAPGIPAHREDPPGLDGMVFVQDEPLVVPGDTAVVHHRLAVVLAVQFQPVQPVGGGIEADALSLRRLPEPGPAEWRLLMVSDGPREGPFGVKTTSGPSPLEPIVRDDRDASRVRGGVAAIRDALAPSSIPRESDSKSPP